MREKCETNARRNFYWSCTSKNMQLASCSPGNCRFFDRRLNVYMGENLRSKITVDTLRDQAPIQRSGKYQWLEAGCPAKIITKVDIDRLRKDCNDDCNDDNLRGKGQIERNIGIIRR